jgi:hypothetical protein
MRTRTTTQAKEKRVTVRRLDWFASSPCSIPSYPDNMHGLTKENSRAA